MNEIYQHLLGVIMAGAKTATGTWASITSAALIGSFGAIMMIYGELKPLLTSMNTTQQEMAAVTKKLKSEYETVNTKLESLAASAKAQKETNAILEVKLKLLNDQFQMMRNGNR